MKVPCADIARFIKDDLSRQVLQLKKKKITPKLVAFLVGNEPEQLAHVKAQQKAAKEIGVDLELIHIEKPPAFLQFANLLREKSNDAATHGVIIESPLPTSLQSDTIYNFVPLAKELEGHRKKTVYFSPIGLTVLSILKYIFQNTQVSAKLYPDPVKDPSFFKQSLKQKKVVLIGRGANTGAEIAKVLSAFRINFINVNTQTFEPEQYYKDADVIITSIGKRVLKASDVKQGAVLINVGTPDDSGAEGDYDEAEIKSVAGFYTPIHKGTGPIDILYLFKNLIDAAKS